jgi:hypothetical protein
MVKQMPEETMILHGLTINETAGSPTQSHCQSEIKHLQNL